MMHDDSIIGNVPPGEWSRERSVGYEVAREVIGDCIAAISGILHAERQRPHPDQELIARLNAEQDEAALARRTLRSDDLSVIEQVTRRWAARLRELDALLDRP